MGLNPPRILVFDLSSGEQTQLPISYDAQRAFLGGASLGAHLLWAELEPSTAPLSPEAPMIWMTGPLTGTAGPAVGRMVLCGRSPATGLWAESNIGGFIGTELRAAGVDGLILRGRAAEPVYLWIHDGRVEQKPATHLWGQADTYQTQDLIRRELGDNMVRVACIGLAGERQLPFGLVLCDHGRVAGRTGLGAVMGSKNLKAIACRGRSPIPVAEPKAFADLRRRLNLALRDDNLSRALRETGTAGAADYWEYLGTMPKRYFTQGAFARVDQISGTTIAETALVRPSTCHGCVIACGRVVRFGEGMEQKGAEYETTVGFGPQLGIADAAFVARMGDLCDRYGMDTISLSNVLGLAFLLFERGYLKEEDSGGLRLVWGNTRAVESLVHQTARQEGFGATLAKGARFLADQVGQPELAAEVNGLEMPYHDPRGASGMALVYATSPRGACHNQSDYFLVDGLGHTFEEVGVGLLSRWDGAVKAGNVARHQDWRTLGNSLVMCFFSNVSGHDTLALVNRATGFDYSLAELMEVGERAWNLKRQINLRLGWTKDAERLPPLLLQPLADGGTRGYVPPLREMLRAYYMARGWDEATGRPKAETLQRLGLDPSA
jgi:aldehyde:ferredoxin oxidoreductase